MDITYIFKEIFRRKWIILICMIVAMSSAFFLTRNLKKGYKSIAQLSTGFTESETTDPTKGVNFLQSELRFNNAIENINSPKVLSLVSYGLLLHDLKNPDEQFSRITDARLDSNKLERNSLIMKLSNSLDSMKMLSSADSEEKRILGFLGILKYNIESITKDIKVGRFQKSDYINIEFVSENPFMSAFVVNTLYKEFKRFYGQNERVRTNLSLTSLDSLVKQKKAILDQKQLAKQQFMSGTGTLDPGLEGSSKLSQINSLEGQLVNEKGIFQSQTFKVQQLNDLIQALKNKGGTTVPSPNGSNSPGINSNSEYLILRKQYNELYNEYIKNGGTDTEMKKRLDKISQDMVLLKLKETGGQRNTLNKDGETLDGLIQKSIDARAELEASKTKIGTIETMLRQLKGGISGMASTSAAAKQYDNEIQLAYNEYTEATDQLNAASNYSETKPDNFKQTLVGQPALKPEPSKRMMIIILSGMMAFFLVSLVVIFREVMDQSIKTPSHFLRIAELPLLGTVNKIKLNKQNLLERVTTFDEEEKHRDNIFLELLRKLRYEIESSGKKIFLFTSTEPQQGKTALIQAISYILHLGKKRVLIIDTNFCNNDLTTAINAAPVLEKFELNSKPFDTEALKSLVTPTIVEGVDIVGCQGGDYTPSEILPRNHLLKYLGQLKEEYDFIFMEGAPLNGFTDTKELLPFAEGMIAIFSAEKFFSAADRESVKFLRDNKDKFLGVILNKVEGENLDL